MWSLYKMDFSDRQTEDPARVRLWWPGFVAIDTDSPAATINGATVSSAVYLTGDHTLELAAPLTRCRLDKMESSELTSAQLDAVIEQLEVDTSAGTDRGKRAAIDRHLAEAGA